MNEWAEHFDLKYNLTLEDYYYFNLIVFDETMRTKRKKQTAVGIVSVMVAAVVLSTFFITSEFQLLFITVSFTLTLFGIHSIILHPILLPRQLRKAVEKKYIQNNLKNEQIYLKINKDGFTEHSGKEEVVVSDVSWKDVEAIYISDYYVVIIVENLEGVLIPCRSLSSISDSQMKGFVIDKAKKNNVKVMYQK